MCNEMITRGTEIEYKNIKNIYLIQYNVIVINELYKNNKCKIN